MAQVPESEIEPVEELPKLADIALGEQTDVGVGHCSSILEVSRALTIVSPPTILSLRPTSRGARSELSFVGRRGARHSNPIIARFCCRARSNHCHRRCWKPSPTAAHEASLKDVVLPPTP